MCTGCGCHKSEIKAVLTEHELHRCERCGKPRIVRRTASRGVVTGDGHTVRTNAITGEINS